MGVHVPQNIIGTIQKIVGEFLIIFAVPEIMVCLSPNTIWMSQNMVRETKNMVSKSENIFWVTRTMLSAAWKIFAIIQNIVRVMQIIFSTKEEIIQSACPIFQIQFILVIISATSEARQSVDMHSATSE